MWPFYFLLLLLVLLKVLPLLLLLLLLYLRLVLLMLLKLLTNICRVPGFEPKILRPQTGLFRRNCFLTNTNEHAVTWVAELFTPTTTVEDLKLGGFQSSRKTIQIFWLTPCFGHNSASHMAPPSRACEKPVLAASAFLNFFCF